MPWMIPTAIVGGSVIGSLGAGSAAKTQANATTQGIGEQRREFDITRADTAPYRDAGTGALAQLQAALGMKGPDTVYTGKSRQELSDIIASLKQQGAATKDPLFDREIADATTALNSGQNAGPGAPNPGRPDAQVHRVGFLERPGRAARLPVGPRPRHEGAEERGAAHHGPRFRGGAEGAHEVRHRLHRAHDGWRARRRAS
jgi:hypothetical protein